MAGPPEGSAQQSSTSQPRKPARKPKAKVADSWDDESVSSEDSDREAEEDAAKVTFSPQSKAHNEHADILAPSSASNQWPSSPDPLNPESERRRPEKQTAVASRIISNALGVRSKRTEEQKAYDRAVLENERKKRERERELVKQKREDEEKAKQAVWES